MVRSGKGETGIGYAVISLAIELAKKMTSKYKIKILEILKDGKEMSISDLQRELGISYKETYRHVKEMVKSGVLTREKKLNEKFQPVIVKYSGKVM